MRAGQRTKIVATIGPASGNETTLRALMTAGLDVVRLNFSHGGKEQHTANVALVRKLDAELGANGEDRLHFAGEDDAPGGPGDVHRLFAEAVPGEEEFALSAIPEGEGEHAVEALEAVRAPLLVGAKDGLRIARGAEDVAEVPQLLPELDVVVDLAIEDEAEVREVVDERLIGSGGEVDDGEAGVAEADTGGEIGAIAVGAAVAQRGDHGLNLARGNGLAAGAHDARDTAHRSCILPESAASVSGRMVPAGTATG